MRTNEVKQRRYSLSGEEIAALRVVDRLLGQIENDEELAEAIRCECCVRADAEEVKDFIQTILNLNETDIDLC